jgi:hypothetical protein
MQKPATDGTGTRLRPGARAPRGALGYVRIPAPTHGERFGWPFERGDRLAFDFDPDAGDGRRFEDRLVSVRLPDGRVLPLDTIVSDDETIDRIARSLSGPYGETH